jgi:hypothetical protein
MSGMVPNSGSDSSESINIDLGVVEPILPSDREERIAQIRGDAEDIGEAHKKLVRRIVESVVRDSGGERLVMAGLNLSPFQTVAELQAKIVASIVKHFGTSAAREYVEDDSFSFSRKEIADLVRSLIEVAFRDHGLTIMDIFDRLENSSKNSE